MEYIRFFLFCTKSSYVPKLYDIINVPYLSLAFNQIKINGKITAQPTGQDQSVSGLQINRFDSENIFDYTKNIAYCKSGTHAAEFKYIGSNVSAYYIGKKGY